MEFNPVVNEKSFKEHIRSIVRNPFNAIVELIANAHDAGATELHIDWDVDFLNNKSSLIKFKDNGKGMSNEEFKRIWVELSYDRLKNNNGDSIEIETGNDEIILRKVYGKNGKGRHAPFAFSNKYEVKTINNGECSIFEISEDPKKGFAFSEKDNFQTDEKNGTCISFKITKIDNNITVEQIKETIATRFLKDANFNIFLNNELIELGDISNENKTEFTCTYKDKEIKIIKIKSNTTSHLMKFHGISWKFGNRIFSDNWDNILDGRLALAKKYNFIISAEFLADSLNDTMTGFDEDADVEDVKECIYDCIRNSLKKDLQKAKNVKKKEIIEDNFNSIKKLGLIDKKEVVDFINEVQDKCPSIKPEDLKATTKIFINLKESHKGYELLHKLSTMSSKELDDLDDILEEWTIGQAKYVLDLIQERLNFISTLEEKMDDPTTDEVHELQVLFEKGLWVFGPDFESIEFTSNKTLKNVIRKLFKQEANVDNPLFRPDFVVLPDGNLNIYSTDSFDNDREVNGIDRVLIIELKRGGSNIGITEKGQAEKYIMELYNGKHINPDAKVDAYVLGSTIDVEPADLRGKPVSIIPMKYSVVVRRAERRLFNLRDKIKSSKNISLKTGDEVFDEIMGQESLDSY